MQKSRNLFLTASILGAALAASAVPASAFSFIPTSGSLAVSNPASGPSTIVATLFDASNDELSLFGTGTLFTFGTGDYLGSYSNAAYFLSGPSVASASGIIPGGLVLDVKPGGLLTLIGGSGFNLSIPTTSSPINAVPGNNNVGTTAPVPEASTLVSFGLLMLGGGLMASRRQKVAAKAA